MITLGETIDKCNPEIKNELINLFNTYGTLENILKCYKGRLLYSKLMLSIIIEREYEIGFVKLEPFRYEHRSFKEIYKNYGRTIVMPY